MSDTHSPDRKMVQLAAGAVLLVDSVSVLAAGDADVVVVGGSPCDRPSVARALAFRPTAIFLRGNSEVVVESEASGLVAADEAGVPCGAVAAVGADGNSMWASGKLLAINAAARRRGVTEGMNVQQAAGILLAWARVS